MTQNEYDALIVRLENKWQQTPKALFKETFSLIWLAYGYLLLVLLFSVSLIGIGLLVVLKTPYFGWVLLAFGVGVVLSIIRGVFVRMPAPGGSKLNRQDAPRLFAMLDKLSTGAGGAKFHEVQLSPELNAAVVQRPRLGIFGWPKNYLILGLPLMQSMTPQEFTAILAHEFAHMAHSHGSSGHKIYRVRRTIESIITTMAEKGQGTWLLAKFINWFWPRFNARAFIISRANEYEADAFAASVTGAETMASALKRLPILQLSLEEYFWKDISLSSLHSPTPPAHLFRKMKHSLEEMPGRHNLANELTAAFNRKTNSDDTHPCLSDRLAALRQLPNPLPGEIPPPPSETAACEFLNQSAEAHHMDRFSQEWERSVAREWAEQHRTMKANAAELENLRTRIVSTTRKTEKVDLLLNKIRLLRILGRGKSSEAEGALCQLLAEQPNHQVGQFLQAVDELEKGNPAAVETLTSIMWQEPSLAVECFSALYDFHEKRREYEACKVLKSKRDELANVIRFAQMERSELSPGDRLLAPEFSPELLEEVRRFLGRLGTLKHAWIARKQTRYHQDTMHYVIALEVAGLMVSDARKSEAAGAVGQRIPLKDASWVVFDVSSSAGKLIKATHGSQIL